MKPRVVYVSNGAAPPDKPTVRISKTNEGITFAITATGKSLTKARQRAELEFRALVSFCKEIEKQT